VLAENRVYAQTEETPLPDVVVVGAAARDIAPDDRRGWRMGGSVLYCGLGLARLGLRVGCLVGLDRKARQAGNEVKLLEEAGATVVPVPLDSGAVFENTEVAGGARRQRWLSKSDAIQVPALPEAWRAAGGWLLVPVSGEVGEEWADVPGPRARVALGLQGLTREFPPDGWVEPVAPQPSRLIERAGLVVLSAHDLPSEEAPESLRLLTEAVIVATAGAEGGVALHRTREIKYKARVVDPVVDPTGAGDVFLAALMGAWQAGGALATKGALVYAAAAASCAVEAVGLAGVPTREEVAARLRRA
jgi:sugar/nucleoside kinase (ribokinase family)